MVALALGFVCLAGLAMMGTNHACECAAIIGLPIGFGPIYILKQAREFDAAERAWLQRRYAVVKKPTRVSLP